MSTIMNSNIVNNHDSDSSDYIFVDEVLEYKCMRDVVKTYHISCYEPITGDFIVSL